MRENRREYWSKLIAEQEASGQAARSFCRERGLGEHCFYNWRRRLANEGPVRFALLQTKPVSTGETPWPLELVLCNGERLRIGKGVDTGTLRTVLETVRE